MKKTGRKIVKSAKAHGFGSYLNGVQRTSKVDRPGKKYSQLSLSPDSRCHSVSGTTVFLQV